MLVVAVTLGVTWRLGLLQTGPGAPTGTTTGQPQLAARDTDRDEHSEAKANELRERGVETETARRLEKSGLPRHIDLKEDRQHPLAGPLDTGAQRLRRC